MIVGLGSGLVVVFYRLILEKVEHIRQFVFSSQHSIWYTISWFILLILVALFVGKLMMKDPMICGSGIPQVEGVLANKLKMNPLNLAILFSLRFRQAATSALASVAVWLFFSVFYTMIVNLVAKGLSPSQMASPYQIISYQKFILGLMRLAPSELFNEATTTLLMPSVRSLGPLTMEQVQGAIPSPIPLGQSLLVVWPQLTGLIAATVICFAISYIMFMRREIRSR